MNIEFINLQSQYKKYKDEVDKEIQYVLNNSTYIMGPKVDELERNLVSFTGSRNAIACSSGTDALVLALMSIDIHPGDEIITTPFTFIATAEVIAFLGAIPVFVDIDEKTYNINHQLVEEKITNKTKAIIPVSLFGQMSNMNEINKIAQNHNIIVIEDAAQSFGARNNKLLSCNASTIATTSFFPAKPLGCYGDGGAIFTNDDGIAEKLRILLNHGQTKRYVHSKIGINGRIDAIQAAVLNVKLKYYNDEIKKRQEIALYYNNLKNVIIPFIEESNLSVWAQYCIRVENRDKMMKKCMDNKIPTAVYYPIPLHLQEVFSYLGYKKNDFPMAEKISKDIMALPMSAFLTREEQDFIIRIINE